MIRPHYMLDANILFELFFRRPRHQAVLQELAAKEGIYVTTVLSVTFLMYEVKKHGFDEQRVHAFLGGYKIVGVDYADYQWAADNEQGDFEDALQVASAIRYGCSQFITIDKQLAERHNKHISTHLAGY